MVDEDDPITPFFHRHVEVRRIVLRMWIDASGDLQIVWAWKAMVGRNVIFGEGIEDATRRIDRWLDAEDGR